MRNSACVFGFNIHFIFNTIREERTYMNLKTRITSRQKKTLRELSV